MTTMTALFEHYAIRQLSMQALRKIAGPTATSALLCTPSGLVNGGSVCSAQLFFKIWRTCSPRTRNAPAS